MTAIASYAARLEGVPRTALWTLHCRAAMAERGRIDDPEAIRVRDALGLDLKRDFGRPDPAFAERARLFDGIAQRFLDRFPRSEVVSLGEGLETQRARLRGYAGWTSVDLPEVMRVRDRVLPPGSGHRHFAGSVTAPGWLRFASAPPSLVIAQGLVMYLERPETVALIRRAFEAGVRRWVMDVVPPWVAGLSRFPVPMTPRFWVPRMGWGARRAGLEALVAEALAGRPHQLELVRCPLPGGPVRWVDHTLVAVIDAA